MAVIEIVASGGPIGPGQIAAGTITVVPGNTYIVTASVKSGITFKVAGGISSSFDVSFAGSNTNDFTIKFESNTKPNIIIGNSTSLPKVNIDASNAASVGLTVGNGVTLEEYKGSNGADTIRIGDNFTTTKDFKTGNGSDEVVIGNNADFGDHNLEFGQGDNSVSIGTGLTANDIKAADGNNVINIGLGASVPPDPRTVIHNMDVGNGNNIINFGDGLTANDIKTGNGNNVLTFGDGLVAEKIETGDGIDSIRIGDGAAVKELKTDKGNDEVTIGNNYVGEKLEAGDGDDLVSIGANGSIPNKLDGGDGNDSLISGTVFPGATNFETVVCFATGTLISARSGEVPVEQLRVGDLVQTLDHGMQPVIWIGQTHVGQAALKASPNLRPIRVRANALGNGSPSRDLVVSPQHRILVSSKITEKMFRATEVLVAAKHLLKVPGIEIANDLEEITYMHVLLDQHEILISNGARSESLFLGQQAIRSLSSEAQREIGILFPELSNGEYVQLAARPFISSSRGHKLAERHTLNNKPLIPARLTLLRAG